MFWAWGNEKSSRFSHITRRRPTVNTVSQGNDVGVSVRLMYSFVVFICMLYFIYPPVLMLPLTNVVIPEITGVYIIQRVFCEIMRFTAHTLTHIHDECGVLMHTPHQKCIEHAMIE